jgi:hypothetical protein
MMRSSIRFFFSSIPALTAVLLWTAGSLQEKGSTRTTEI